MAVCFAALASGSVGLLMGFESIEDIGTYPPRERSNGEVHFGELGASLMKKRFDPL
jgi:hypothetical protein